MKIPGNNKSTYKDNYNDSGGDDNTSFTYKWTQRFNRYRVKSWCI